MITNSTQYTPFGGLHLVHQEIITKKLIGFINESLPERGAGADYRYSDLLLSRLYTSLCGGDCAEDINYIKDTIFPMKEVEAPSADTIQRMEKELSTPAEIVYGATGSVNKLNINDDLSSLLVSTANHLGLLSSKAQDYCLDFDHQFIPAQKHDATYNYKQHKGYFPGIASIDNIPVYIENRNGNCHVNLNQKNTLERCLLSLQAQSITVKKARMDSGSYTKEVVDFLDQSKIQFYIRAEQSDTLLFSASMKEGWQDIEIGVQNYQVNSIEHEFGEKTHRVVCYRFKNKTGQTRTMTGDDCNYLFIITNDRKTHEKDIIEFYNQRGNSERLFAIQNNDFNWNKLPYSFLEENTVYLIIMAICNVIYQWMIKLFAAIFEGIALNSRLKKFTFHVICMVAKVTTSGRRKVVKVFSNNSSP